jgi:hypothetical protein
MIIAAEDSVTLAIARKVVATVAGEGEIITVCPGGRSKLKARIPSLVRSCYGGLKVVVCADLDMDPCLVRTRELWLPNGVPQNMALAFAVREADAWLLADPGIGRFLSSSVPVPVDPEVIQDPKAALLNMARNSRSRAIREAMIHPNGSLTRVGPGYNATLINFISSGWDIEESLRRSASFRRFRERVINLAER